eukprot:871695-Prymnesium_polylepis.1
MLAPDLPQMMREVCRRLICAGRWGHTTGWLVRATLSCLIGKRQAPPRHPNTAVPGEFGPECFEVQDAKQPRCSINLGPLRRWR